VSCSTSALQEEVLQSGRETPAEVEMAKPLVKKSMTNIDDTELVDANAYSNNNHLDEICGRYVERLSSLDKGTVIASSGRDSMFPESLQSIARAGTVYCGDTAAGIKRRCSDFNHWASVRTLRGTASLQQAPEPELVSAASIPAPPAPPSPAPTPAQPSPAPITKPPNSTIILVELGRSDDNTKCINVDANQICKITIKPSGNYQYSDIDGKLCISSPGGWKENVKFSCTAYDSEDDFEVARGRQL